MPRFSLRYPRSFLSLLLVGFAIVTSPLIAGLMSNAYSIDRLSEKSQQAVASASRLTQNARQLVAQAAAFERIVRQSIEAGTASSSGREGLARTHEALQQAVRPFSSSDASAEMRVAAANTDQRAQAVVVAFTTAPPPGQSVENDLNVITRSALAINQLANQQVELEISALRTLAEKSKRQVFWQVLAMIPSAILLVAGFTFLLSRPINALDVAINRLGEGKLAKRIRVEGPRDIARLGEQLDWLRQRLITLEDQKTRFFQHVSHELKTPLTALHEGSSLLSDEVIGQLNAEQRDVVRIITHNSHTLERLIQDLLTYSQLQSSHRIKGTLTAELKPVDLTSLIEAVLNRHQLAIKSKALNMTSSLATASIEGDAVKLRAVFDNLVSNAIKYAPVAGQIGVQLHIADGNAVVDVTDNGPGIASEDLERVFEPFYRGSRAVTSEVKGTGLGLAIAHDYVLLHHGQIRAFAEIANGAHFRVTLPITAVLEPDSVFGETP